MPGPPASDEAEAGASLIVNASASPYHAGKGLAARADAQPARARQPRARSRSATWSAARTSWSSTATRCSSTTRAACSRARRSSPRRWWSRRVDLQAALTARLRDTRLRPPAQKVLPEIRHAGRFERPEHPPVDHVEGTVADLLEPDAEVYAALVPRRARLRREERLRARRARPLGRDRLDARGADRRRRARAREGHVRRDAVASAPPRARRRTRASSRRNLGVSTFDLPIAPAMETYDADARRPVRGPRPRHHRGEPAGAHPRQPADGAVEQVRLARADDRQQVRDRGRLLDALRRHRRRLRGHQGRAEDARLPARRLPQRARRRASGAGLDHRPPAERRAAPGPAGRRLAARLRHARRDPRGLRRGGRRPRARCCSTGFERRASTA